MVQQESKSINPRKNVAFKNYRNNSSNIDLKCYLKYLQAYLIASVEVAKEKYYHNTVQKHIAIIQQSILVSIKSFLK